MRLIFAGTPEFAAKSLEALHLAKHDIALVLTQPDRPSGRGMNLKPSPVKTLAQSIGIEVFQPNTLKDPVAQDKIRAIGAEVMIVAAYGLILPQAVLDTPKHGCINIHASLLPRWRGAAPIQRAILAGDTQTGVCIMQMEAGLDTGPVLLKGTTPILGGETTASLHDKLAEQGATLINQALTLLETGNICPEKQSEEGIEYAHKIDKTEAQINWKDSALQISRQIRAFNPAPGAFSTLNQTPVKIWQAQITDKNGPPGTILEIEKDGIIVACGENSLKLTILQKAGSKRLSAAQFLTGNNLQKGDFFAMPA